MIVLGIETSCDETAAAVVRNGTEVLASEISSQVELHSSYGGVVPELAARQHLRNLGPVVAGALRRSGLDVGRLDAVAATSRPGLVPALLVGFNYAKGMAMAAGLPLIAVNHFTAHLYSCFLDRPEWLKRGDIFPLLALIVSGGHTSLALVREEGALTVVGRTIDDAAGEAFDKGAKILGLGYPGGPQIERAAAGGNPRRYKFPRGLTGGGGKPVAPADRFNFSFSGVKTALLYRVRRQSTVSPSDQADLAASYQAALVDVLVKKTMAAAQEYSASTVLLAGGVACNQVLRQRLQREVETAGRQWLAAAPHYCADNAAMVAGLAWHDLRQGRAAEMKADVQARLPDTLEPITFFTEHKGGG